MTDRTYDIHLDCGCMISLDGGGGLMPCYYDEATDAEEEKHNKAWKKYRSSPEYKEHQEETYRRNQ